MEILFGHRIKEQGREMGKQSRRLQQLSEVMGPKRKGESSLILEKDAWLETV